MNREKMDKWINKFAELSSKIEPPYNYGCGIEFREGKPFFFNAKTREYTEIKNET